MYLLRWEVSGKPWTKRKKKKVLCRYDDLTVLYFKRAIFLTPSPSFVVGFHLFRCFTVISSLVT